jgi:hypothetical protein
MKWSGVVKRSRVRVVTVVAVCAMGAVFVLPGSALAQSSGDCINLFNVPPTEQYCAITTTSLNEATAGSPYSTPLASAGMLVQTTWILNGGAPTWLTASPPAGLDGTLSGTPTTDGSYQVNIVAIDVFGNSLETTLPLIVVPAITPPKLQLGMVGSPYSSTVPGLFGASPQVTWSATGLPAGLTVNSSNGQITGTPTTAGSYSVKLTVADTTAKVVNSVTLPINIFGISTTSLPGGLAGSQYSASPTAPGDPGGALTWTATGLPAGLSINEFTGQITGTPSSPGNTNVTLTAADAVNKVSVTKTLPLTVLGLNTSSLPGGTVGTPYSVAMSATGGAAPLTWSASNLPAGLSIDPATGVISGTPTTVGNNVVTVTVTDSSTPAVSDVLTAALNIAAAVAPPPPPPPPLGQLLLGAIKPVGAQATVPLSCQGSANQICVGTVVATATEHVKSGTVQAITASAKRHGKGKKKGGGKGKTVTTVVTVASGSYSINAGQSANIPLTLNATGRRLLGEFFRLPVNLSVSGGATPVTSGLTFKYAIVNATVNYTWSFSAQSTTAQSLTVRGLRSSYRVAVICRGGGCPFSQKGVKAKGGGAAITPLLAHAKLAPHTVVEVVVSAPNSVSQVEEFVIRAGAAPTAEALCEAPGVRQPGPCHAP